MDISPFLFCNAAGKSYVNKIRRTASGFNSMRQNFIPRLLAEAKVTERFIAHDMRAKCASYATSLETT